MAFWLPIESSCTTTLQDIGNPSEVSRLQHSRMPTHLTSTWRLFYITGAVVLVFFFPFFLQCILVTGNSPRYQAG